MRSTSRNTWFILLAVATLCCVPHPSLAYDLGPSMDDAAVAPPPEIIEEPVEPPPFGWLADEEVPLLRGALDAGLNPNFRDSEGNTLLMMAAAAWGRPGLAFQLLLERGADVNARSREGKTALMFAAASFNPESVRKLLDRGADIRARDRWGQTSLHWCANWYQGDLYIGSKETRHAECARTLLKAGAEVNAPDKAGMTPLMHAAAGGHGRIVSTLLEHGANANLRDRRKRSALTWCARAGTTHPVVSELLEAGARVGLMEALLLRDLKLARERVGVADALGGRDPCGRTVLHLAALEGDLQLVRQLVAAGANLDARDRDENTVLMYATGAEPRANVHGFRYFEERPVESREELIRWLAARTGAINKTNSLGEAPLHWAIALKRPDLVRLLVRHGANVNLPMRYSFTRPPLISAIERRDLPTIEVLLDLGADPNRVNGLATACGAGDEAVAVVEALLRAGAWPNGPNWDLGGTLRSAAWSGNLRLARILLAHGAKVGHPGDFTALAIAAYGGHLEMVNLLLGAGADVNQQCRDGRTPLELARAKGHTAIVDRLLAAGALP